MKPSKMGVQKKIKKKTCRMFVQAMARRTQYTRFIYLSAAGNDAR